MSKRFAEYFNVNNLVKNRMNINKALLKYGYANFSLEILECCEPNKCIEREQSFINLLKPEYNILKIAGSFLSYKHSEEANKKKSNTMIGNTFAKYVLGRQREKGAGSPSIPIEVLDRETGIKSINSSMSETDKALKVPS